MCCFEKNGESIKVLNKCSGALKGLKANGALVHHITNYVTVNDCANITLAIGASPVMADSINEVCDMVEIASSLVINIGTLNEKTIESMVAAGIEANKREIPVILDPVGFAATPYRKASAKKLLENVHFTVIKGNVSEIMGIAGIEVSMKGVDSSDNGDEMPLEMLLALSDYSKSNDTTLAVTGKVDYIINGYSIVKVYNGHPYLKNVTGTGCMIASLIGSYIGSGCDASTAALSGILTMDISGECAYNALDGKGGIGTFKLNLFDQISNFISEKFIKEGKIDAFEVR